MSGEMTLSSLWQVEPIALSAVDSLGKYPGCHSRGSVIARGDRQSVDRAVTKESTEVICKVPHQKKAE